MNKFKIWLEAEASMGSQMPDMYPHNNTNAPASNAIIQTGLQPQVDTQPMKMEPDQDKISAIDSGIAHFKNQLPEKGGEKVEKFLKLFKNFEAKWEKIKNANNVQNQETGLGNVQNQPYADFAQKTPNALPVGLGADGNTGPGIFGNH